MYCLVFFIGSCVPVHEDRTVSFTAFFSYHCRFPQFQQSLTFWCYVDIAEPLAFVSKIEAKISTPAAQLRCKSYW